MEPYRIVRVQPIQDDDAWTRGDNVAQEAVELVRLFRQVHEGQGPSLLLAETFGQNMSPESILNTVSMHLNVEPDMKERLLEMDSLEARYHSVLEILRNATTTQERIERVRHLYPRDKRIN